VCGGRPGWSRCLPGDGAAGVPVGGAGARAGIRRGFPSRPGGIKDPPAPGRERLVQSLPLPPPALPSPAPHTASIRPAVAGGNISK